MDHLPESCLVPGDAHKRRGDTRQSREEEDDQRRVSQAHAENDRGQGTGWDTIQELVSGVRRRGCENLDHSRQKA